MNMDINEISTEDFSNMFINGFEGEEGFKEQKQAKESADDDMTGYDLYNEMGNEIDFANIVDENPLDDLSDIPESSALNDFMEARELDAPISIGGVRYEREQVEKALSMHSNLDGFAAAINATMSELETYEEEVNRFNYMANAHDTDYLNYWQAVVDNENSDPQEVKHAVKEIREINSQRHQREQQYSKVFEETKAKKAMIEKRKGEAIANQLLNIGWKNTDFETVAKYMQANNVNIPFANVDSNIMIALKKAAMFDNKEKAKMNEGSSNVQRAISGQPQRQSKPAITAEDNRKKARAKQLAQSGELSHQDMYSFLED